MDQALASVDFAPLAGQSVYVDEKYVECTDKKYVVGALRRASLQAGARLVDKLEEADLVLEAHVGAVGTDRTEQYLGVPGFKAPSPIALEVPEVRFLSRTKQIGTAKLSLVVYDAKSRRAAGPGGLAVSRSVDSNWYVLGLGPINRGTIQEEFAALTGRYAFANGKQVLLVADEPASSTQPPAFSAPGEAGPPPSAEQANQVARREADAAPAQAHPGETLPAPPPANPPRPAGATVPLPSEADGDAPRFDFSRWMQLPRPGQ